MVLLWFSATCVTMKNCSLLFLVSMYMLLVSMFFLTSCVSSIFACSSFSYIPICENWYLLPMYCLTLFIFLQYFPYTANERSVRIQYKCLVPIYVFSEMKLRRPRYFQNKIKIKMFCLPTSTFVYFWAIYIFPCLVCRGPTVGIYNRSQIHVRRNWKQGRAVSYLEIYV